MLRLTDIPQDKLLHFAVCAIISLLSVVGLDLLGLSTAVVAVLTLVVVSVVGLGKEYAIDESPDIWDVVANYAGAIVVLIAYIV